MLKRDTTNTQHLQQQQQQQQGRESLVGRQLYVGNIPTNVGWKEIKDLMRQAGNVIRVNILTNDEKQPHAIVLFSTLKDAQKAIGVFNGYKWSGNQLVVREDTSLYGIVMNKNVDESNSFAGSHDVMESSSEYQSHQLTGQNQGQNDDQTGNRKQLPYIVGWQDLKDLFREAGTVVRTDIKHDPKTGKSKGMGTVLFTNNKSADLAITMFDGFEWFGRRIEVREDKTFKDHHHQFHNSVNASNNSAPTSQQQQSQTGENRGKLVASLVSSAVTDEDLNIDEWDFNNFVSTATTVIAAAPAVENTSWAERVKSESTPVKARVWPSAPGSKQQPELPSSPYAPKSRPELIPITSSATKKHLDIFGPRSGAFEFQQQHSYSHQLSQQQQQNSGQRHHQQQKHHQNQLMYSSSLLSTSFFDNSSSKSNNQSSLHPPPALHPRGRVSSSSTSVGSGMSSSVPDSSKIRDIWESNSSTAGLVGGLSRIIGTSPVNSSSNLNVVGTGNSPFMLGPISLQSPRFAQSNQQQQQQLKQSGAPGLIPPTSNPWKIENLKRRS